MDKQRQDTLDAVDRIEKHHKSEVAVANLFNNTVEVKAHNTVLADIAVIRTYLEQRTSALVEWVNIVHCGKCGHYGTEEDFTIVTLDGDYVQCPVCYAQESELQFVETKADILEALIALEAEIARLTAERDAANKIAEERRAELIREGNEKSEVWVELSSERVSCEKAERERDRLINHLLKIGEYNSCPNGKSPSDCKHDCYTCWLAWAREGE